MKNLIKTLTIEEVDLVIGGTEKIPLPCPYLMPPPPQLPLPPPKPK